MRLLRPTEFARVMAARMSCVDGMLRVYGVANDLGHPRLGLTVSRKVGGAVERTRWKRALREAFRLEQHRLPALDIVCLPHRTATADVHQLRLSLPKLARQLETRLAARRERAQP
ncbi:MAG TPA: ribonuclease P protein component [Lacipirellulaceae bacterium]|nr:ribonuclease P protein component [Lacipirellulaceae bacterium]